MGLKRGKEGEGSFIQAPTTATPCRHCPINPTGTHLGLWWAAKTLRNSPAVFAQGTSVWLPEFVLHVHIHIPPSFWLVMSYSNTQTDLVVLFHCACTTVVSYSTCKDTQGRVEGEKHTVKSLMFMFLSSYQLYSQRKWGTCHPMRSGSLLSPLDAAPVNCR